MIMQYREIFSSCVLCIVPPYGRAEYCPILPDPEEEGDTALTLLPVKENVCGRGKTNKNKKKQKHKQNRGLE